MITEKKSRWKSKLNERQIITKKSLISNDIKSLFTVDITWPTNRKNYCTTLQTLWTTFIHQNESFYCNVIFTSKWPHFDFQGFCWPLLELTVLTLTNYLAGMETWRAHNSQSFSFRWYFDCFGCHTSSYLPFESFFNFRIIWPSKTWVSEAQRIML